MVIETMSICHVLEVAIQYFDSQKSSDAQLTHDYYLFHGLAYIE